ncbi:DUF4234 domain-containing protein [Pseudomonas sp. S2_B03]
MSDISTLKEKNNLKTLHFILLTVVTMGLYSVVWLHKTTTVVEEVTQIKTLSQTGLVVYLALCGIGGIFFTVSDPRFIATGYAMTVIAQLIAIAWCFRVRRALRAYTLTKQLRTANEPLVFSPVHLLSHQLLHQRYGQGQAQT